MTETLRIRRATVDDMETIIDDLIDDARAWLPSKDTDQWARPWPSPAARDARVLRDLKAGRTWLVEDGDAPVATVTCNDKGNRRLWTPEEQLVSAAYAARLLVRPGLTGFAQLRMDRDTTWAEKLAHDLEYLADRSVGLYVRLLFATAGRLVKRLVVEVPAALRGRSKA